MKKVYFVFGVGEIFIELDPYARKPCFIVTEIKKDSSWKREKNYTLKV